MPLPMNVREFTIATPDGDFVEVSEDDAGIIQVQDGAEIIRLDLDSAHRLAKWVLQVCPHGLRSI